MRTLPILAAAVLALAACTDFRSIFPIADPDETLEEPGIVGDWVIVPEDPSEDSTASDRPGMAGEFAGDLFRVWANVKQPGEYRLTYVDSLGNTSRMLVRPTRIGGRLVLDLCADTTVLDGADMLPVHTAYFVVRLVPDTMVIALLDRPLSLVRGERGPGLAHVELPANAKFDTVPHPVVTASTSEIREFLARVLALPDALETDTLTFRRLR